MTIWNSVVWKTSRSRRRTRHRRMRRRHCTGGSPWCGDVTCAVRPHNQSLLIQAVVCPSPLPGGSPPHPPSAVGFPCKKNCTRASGQSRPATSFIPFESCAGSSCPLFSSIVIYAIGFEIKGISTGDVLPRHLPLTLRFSAIPPPGWSLEFFTSLNIMFSLPTTNHPLFYPIIITSFHILRLKPCPSFYVATRNSS